jgi:hypothetical protein
MPSPTWSLRFGTGLSKHIACGAYWRFPIYGYVWAVVILQFCPDVVNRNTSHVSTKNRVIVNWNHRTRSNNQLLINYWLYKSCVWWCKPAGTPKTKQHAQLHWANLSIPVPSLPYCLCSNACGWLVAPLQWKLAMENHAFNFQRKILIAQIITDRHRSFMFEGCWGNAHIYTCFTGKIHPQSVSNDPKCSQKSNHTVQLYYIV